MDSWTINKFYGLKAYRTTLTIYQHHFINLENETLIKAELE